MNEKEISLREWIASFDAGAFESCSLRTQISAGWYDWFCNDSSLKNKTYRLAPKIKKIAKSPKVNLDKMSVFFKNNCPLNGSLYDDFRICDLKTGDPIFVITPKEGHVPSKGKSTVWGCENNFEAPLVYGSWKDVCSWFGV